MALSGKKSNLPPESQAWVRALEATVNDLTKRLQSAESKIKNLQQRTK